MYWIQHEKGMKRGRIMQTTIKLKKMVRELKLKLLTQTVDYSESDIVSRDINRPGIQLTGYFEHYDPLRIQILGYVEVMYLKGINETERRRIYNNFFSLGAPCYIFCRDLTPDDLFLEIAVQKGIPVFSTYEITSVFTSTLIRWLHLNLGPVITIHGCLVDVYGTGVFIRGESGIGKSEATLELVKRGHRLISDDAVEIHHASNTTLFGKAPGNIRDFIELRGIGIIDVKTLYGVQAILETQQIDLVVTLEEWNKHTQYDRLGLQENSIEILGNKLPNYIVPIRPGRNLAVILEAAAINFRQKKMGYDATEAFLKRNNQAFTFEDEE